MILTVRILCVLILVDPLASNLMKAVWSGVREPQLPLCLDALSCFTQMCMVSPGVAR